MLETLDDVSDGLDGLDGLDETDELDEALALVNAEELWESGFVSGSNPHPPSSVATRPIMETTMRCIAVMAAASFIMHHHGVFLIIAPGSTQTERPFGKRRQRLSSIHTSGLGE